MPWTSHRGSTTQNHARSQRPHRGNRGRGVHEHSGFHRDPIEPAGENFAVPARGGEVPRDPSDHPRRAPESGSFSDRIGIPNDAVAGPAPRRRLILSGVALVSPGDRQRARSLANDAACRDRFGRMVAVQPGELIDVAIENVSGRQRKVPPDHPMLAAALAVYASFDEQQPCSSRDTLREGRLRAGPWQRSDCDEHPPVRPERGCRWRRC